MTSTKNTDESNKEEQPEIEDLIDDEAEESDMDDDDDDEEEEEDDMEMIPDLSEFLISSEGESLADIISTTNDHLNNISKHLNNHTKLFTALLKKM